MWVIYSSRKNSNEILRAELLSQDSVFIAQYLALNIIQIVF